MMIFSVKRAVAHQSLLGLTFITINGFVDRLYAEIPEEELQDDNLEAPE